MSKSLSYYINNTKYSKNINLYKSKINNYKTKFDLLENLCNSNSNLPGSISQTQTATNLLENNKSTSDLLPEAVNAAKALIEMESVQKTLVKDGMPIHYQLEISRQILDSNLKDSKPIKLN